jgi:adenosylcobinamide kinase / adenosylcobinamide-phosphate guanylyltransferase
VRLAVAAGRDVVFVATARAGDPDMAARVAAHRRERPQGWRTLEEPTRVAERVAELPAEACVVVDCLALWVSNLMAAGAPVERVVDDAERLAAVLAGRPSAIVVTNEVGMGVHPATELGRAFRDQLGRVNATVAARADAAYLVVAGRLLPLLAAADVLPLEAS